MNPRYILERWPHGWIISGAETAGVPIDVLTECKRIFKKGALMDMGLGHHYKVTGRPYVVFVITETEKDAKAWRAHVDASIASLPPQERWWKGMDVGTSSAAIFAALCDRSFPGLKFQAEETARGGSTPADGGDFGRCFRLLQAIPGWKDRLPEVAAAYPATRWPAIIARWDEIAAADDLTKHKILSSIAAP